MNGEMVTKNGELCLLRNVRSWIMVLLRSDLNCPFEGRLDSDRKASKLQGTTTLTWSSKLALIKVSCTFVAAQMTKGRNYSP